MVKSEEIFIDIEKIMLMIPHRYPFLLIDRIITIKKDDYAVGLKNVTINEHFFQGHFIQRKVMPGVLLIESMAQTAGIFVVNSLGEQSEGSLVYFMSVDKGRFRKPVVPGDQLYIKVIKDRNHGNVWRFNCTIEVDKVLVAEARIAAMIQFSND